MLTPEALAVLDLVGFRTDSLSPEVTEVAYKLHIRETVSKMRIETMRLARAAALAGGVPQRKD